jgi:hypothetical protein
MLYLAIGFYGGSLFMKTKCLLLALVLFNIITLSYAHAQDQDDEMIFPESDSETFVPPTGTQGSTPPVIIDESDSSDVSDVEEYDG